MTPEEPPTVTEQALPWGEAGIFDFGKAARPNVEYFNCSLVTRSDGDWLITRRSVWMAGVALGQNDIVAFLLDDNLVPQHGIKVFIPAWHRKEHFEDPRAVMHNGQIWISACSFVWWGTGWTGAHQVMSSVDDRWAATARVDPVYGKNGPTIYTGSGNEKNWLWFFHNNRPHLVYWATPHTVVEFDEHFSMVKEHKTATELNWHWGEIRGGTPPVLVDNEYWTFFHSSTPWQNGRRRYHMGVYAFQSKPPFAITRISSKPLLTGSTREWWNTNKLPCVFPCGAIVRHGEWLITFGVNDMASGYLKVPHKTLAGKTPRLKPKAEMAMA